MATSQYMSGRKKYARPQAMLWSENPGVLSNGVYVPQGYEVGYDEDLQDDSRLVDQFIILSDDNRGEIGFKPTRIEKRERMINGRMRSFHIADKLTIDVSWNMLPSRSYSVSPEFSVTGQASGLVVSVDHDNNANTPNRPVSPSGSPYYKDQQYTTDGGAGGVELLDWYENHTGPFWVYLAYDKYSNFTGNSEEDNRLNKLQQYNEIVQMYISDFSYSVVKRGGTNYDFWNISVSLEEV
jgi:hypothetical protein